MILYKGVVSKANTLTVAPLKRCGYGQGPCYDLTHNKVMTMTTVKHADNYTHVFKAWAPALGKQPTEAQLATAHVFGRPGKQSFAVAMALRDGGVSGSQIKTASALFDGKATPQLNHMRANIGAGLFERLPVPGVYAVKVTKNGQRFIDQYGKAGNKPTEAKPVKAAAKPVKAPKANKAKGKVTEAPAPAVTATAPQPTA